MLKSSTNIASNTKMTRDRSEEKDLDTWTSRPPSRLLLPCLRPYPPQNTRSAEVEGLGYYSLLQPRERVISPSHRKIGRRSASLSAFFQESPPL